MSTLRQLISDIRSREKLISYDNLITDRVVASEVRSASKVLIKRETDKRRLWGTDTLFTTIPCLEMQEVPLAECCDYTSPKTISRSKYKLPRIAEGKYQYLLQVFNIEGLRKIKYVSLTRYINLLKLDIRSNDIYFWIQNDYLYISDPNVKTVKLNAFFEEDIPYTILYPDCGCDNNLPDCINPLDMEFNLPGYLEEAVKNQVTEVLLQTYEQKKDDVTSNDNPNT